MVSAHTIQDAKWNGNIEILIRENKHNGAYIISILEKLGRLPKHFDGGWLIDLLDSKNDGVRFLAVKNLAKLGGIFSAFTAIKGCLYVF